jgi:hypothetical protein
MAEDYVIIMCSVSAFTEESRSKEEGKFGEQSHLAEEGTADPMQQKERTNCAKPTSPKKTAKPISPLPSKLSTPTNPVRNNRPCPLSPLLSFPTVNQPAGMQHNTHVPHSPNPVSTTKHPGYLHSPLFALHPPTTAVTVDSAFPGGERLTLQMRRVYAFAGTPPLP